MSRGIHLKRLTSNDLGLLGLPEPETDADASAIDHQAPPTPGLPEDEPAPARAAPPPNPRLPVDAQRQTVGRDTDQPPVIDLAEITREVRLGLEDTLRVLDHPDTSQSQA